MDAKSMKFQSDSMQNSIKQSRPKYQAEEFAGETEVSMSQRTLGKFHGASSEEFPHGQTGDNCLQLCDRNSQKTMRSFIKRAIPKTLRKRIEHAEKMQLAHIVPLIWVAGSWIRPERRRLPRLPPNSKNDPLEPQSEAKGVKMNAKSMKIPSASLHNSIKRSRPKYQTHEFA